MWLKQIRLGLQKKPDLKLLMKDGLRAGQTFDIKLTKGVFTVEAPGVVQTQEVEFHTINPGENVRAVVTLKARNRSKTTMMVVFNTLELFDVAGTKKIEIS